MKKMNLILFGLLTLCLASCGPGKTGGSGKGGASMDGVFVDSAVQGLKYSSTSHSGVTTAEGKYTCKTGEVVSFSLPTSGASALALGSIQCRAVVSPIEIVTNGAQTVSDGLSGLNATQLAIVKKTLQVLQTLDADGDATNGISIQASAVDSFVTAFAITDLSVGFADVVGQAGSITVALDVVADAISPGRSAVSETDATAHFETTITTCTSSACTPVTPPVEEEDEDEEEPTEVLGCTNPVAINYNPLATQDDGSCQTPPPMPILGCTDPDATNYNPAATMNMGCTYPPVEEEEEEETPPTIVYGCMDIDALNYSVEVTHDNGTCTYPEPEPVLGCTDPDATNFEPDATEDNGSCTLPPEDDA